MSTGAPPKYHRMGFTCWKCGSRCSCVKMRHVSPTLVEAGYQCGNLDCGHTFVVAIEAIRTLNPGAFPNPPGINVPLSQHVPRRNLADQLKYLPEAAGSGMGDVPIPAQGELELFGGHAFGPS